MSKIKFSKIILIIAFLAISAWFFSLNTPIAKAQTIEELLAQITKLQTQIAQLQKQIAELQAKQKVWCHDFNTNLRIEDRFGDVGYLQAALEKEGFKISEDEKMRNYFGDFTASAVVGFQEKYKGDILAPWGLEHGTGYVGKTTRAKLNALYGCGKKCTLEGESTMPPYNCCPGLKLVADCLPGKACPISLRYCVNCGNGTCDAHENWYNCSEDCKEKSITVLSPNGGERWIVGNTYDIKWESRGIEKVRITLEVGFQQTIPTPIPVLIIDDYPANLGKYSWIVEELPGKWKIRITGKTADGRVVSDLSDDSFSIVSAPTACTDSDGGDNYYTKGYRINQTSGYADYGIQSWDYCILNPYIYPDGSVVSDQSKKVSECSGDNCYLIEYHCKSDLSDAHIGYKCPYGCKDGACRGITVISPNGGETWVRGKTYDITWSSVGVDKVDIYARKIDPTMVCAPCIVGVYCPPCNGTLIAKNISVSLGKYSWTVPLDIALGDKYKIQIGDAGFYLGQNNIYDESDGYFTIEKMAGDVDGDGDVDDTDLQLFCKTYGKSEGEADYNPNADFDNSGRVDYLDLYVLARNYVPSPFTIPPLDGDLDGDCDVDDTDQSLFNATYGKSEGEAGYNPKADFDKSGKVDYLDLYVLARNYGRTCLSLYGDIDGDCDVDGSDLSLLNASYGKSKGEVDYNQKADFNGDDKVDYLDLYILARHYGKTCR